MYVKTSRSRRPVIVSRDRWASTNSPTKNGSFLDSYTVGGYLESQVTYSWRTGRRANKGVPVYGRPPRFSGQPLDTMLRNRKLLYEQVAQSAVNQNYISGGRSIGFNQDHDFWTRRFITAGQVRQKVRNTKYGFYNTDSISYGLAAGNPVPLFNMDGSISNPDLAVSPEDLGLISSRLFSSARPDASIAGIGETVVELVQGNFPALISKTLRAIARQQSAVKALRRTGKGAGQDYLAVTFGWAPIIRDLQSILQHGLLLHDNLYGSYTSRKRSLPGINTSYSIAPSLGGHATSVIPNGLPPMGAFAPTVVYTKEPKWRRVTLDYRLSLHVLNARPGIGSMTFLDKAIAFSQNLGLWTPSLAWDIMPYSWLLDWFTHLGQGINNVSTYSKSGSFPVERATLTSKSTVTDTLMAGSTPFQQVRPNIWAKSSWGTLVSTSYYLERRKANPFNGGLSLTLNPGQWSTLIALGFAKS